MDPKFHPAMEAIKTANLDALKALLERDPSLATDRSSKNHSTLLYGLALEATDAPNRAEMAKVLVDAGSEVNEPLFSAACIDNVEVARVLLDAGAAVNGTGRWAPLEEALYFSNQGVIDLLLERGATIHNLRLAAAMGDVDRIESFFNPDDSLKPEAGVIASPFDTQGDAASVTPESRDPRNVINNAFVYACMRGKLEAAKRLLEKGAEINTIPPGFDFAGTGLHYAAFNGHRELVDFLLKQGADSRITDPKVNSTPAGWAAHNGHQEISDYLERVTAG
jgi:uncharacterized protein